MLDTSVAVNLVDHVPSRGVITFAVGDGEGEAVAITPVGAVADPLVAPHAAARQASETRHSRVATERR
jgi:hypothetical protein